MLSRASTFLGPNGLYSNGSTPSLVLSLDADNLLSYPQSGQTWSDLSVFNNDAIFAPYISSSINPTFDGSLVGSIQFNGSSDYFVFDELNGIPINDSQYTIDVWFKSNSYDPSEQGTLVGWGELGQSNKSNVLRLGGNGFVNYWWGNDIVATSLGMITSNWYNVTVTYDGQDRKIYLNGELKSTDTPGVQHGIDNSDSLQIGQKNNNYFNGLISYVKIYDKSLSSSRISDGFNGRKLKYGYEFGSLHFDTNSSYLFSSSSDYQLTGNFTVEMFFNSFTSSVFNYVFNIGPYTDAQIFCRVETSDDPSLASLTIGGLSTGGPPTYSTVELNKWYHLAISKNGNTSSVYVNGSLRHEISDSYSYDGGLYIGQNFNGLISNFRLINGNGIYTSSFNVPYSKLESITNTKLLITSQKTSPISDVSGRLNTSESSGVSWTSSLPELFISRGLELYVDGANNVSYPGNGLNWYDLSGNNRNLTLDNGLTYSTVASGCLVFDGFSKAQTQEITISYPDGFTMEVIGLFNTTGGLASFNQSEVAKYINILANPGSNLRFETYSGQNFFSNASQSSGFWYHITCVWEAGVAKIYVNGTLDSYATKTSSTETTSNFIIGFHDFYLNGKISLSRFYSTPLTASEVLQNFNYTKNRFAPKIQLLSLTTPSPNYIVASASVVDDKGNSSAVRGFVWNTSGLPTLSDNVVTDPSTGQGTYWANINTGEGLKYVRGYITTQFGTYYSNQLSATAYICLAKGTSILLSNGDTKLIEDITYDDDIMVWNFDDGRLDTSKPLWIKKPNTALQYNLLKFSDGSTLKTIDQHRIFNKEKGQFTYPMTDDTPIGTTTFNSSGLEVELVSKEVVCESVEYYNVITNRHINLFSNSILTSCRYNNIYPIVDMKFTKDDRELRSRDEFLDISDDYFNGLRISEQLYTHDEVVNYVNRLESTKL